MKLCALLLAAVAVIDAAPSRSKPFKLPGQPMTGNVGVPRTRVSLGAGLRRKHNPKTCTLTLPGTAAPAARPGSAERAYGGNATALPHLGSLAVTDGPTSPTSAASSAPWATLNNGRERRAPPPFSAPEKCDTDHTDEVVEALNSGDGDSRHAFFNADGSIVIHWAGAPANEMMVLATMPNLDIFADNSKVHNLYMSTDYGQNYVAAKGIVGPVWHAAFGLVPVPGTERYPVFATPEDGKNKLLWISDDLGAGFTKLVTPAHFDYVVAHPTQHDTIMGLDVDKNGVTDTLYVCTKVFSAGQAKCDKGAANVVDADWVENEDTGKAKGWQVLYTQTKSASDVGRTLVKEGVECATTVGEVNFGKFPTLPGCAQKCKDTDGCKYFIYGIDGKAGNCWMEGGVGSDDCGSEGFEVDSYNLYKLDDSITDAVTDLALNMWSSDPSGNGGTTPKLLRADCQHFVHYNQFVFVTNAPADMEGDNKWNEQELWVMDTAAKTPTFVQAQFPVSQASKQNYFEVVDASEDVVFVSVMHTLTRVQGNAAVDFGIEDSSGYQGCYQNQNDDRDDTHSEGYYTYEACAALAKKEGKKYFGMEAPGGAATDNEAQCLPYDAIPAMNKEPDSDCESELDRAGRRLGGGWRLAMYDTSAADTVQAGHYDAYRALYSGLLPGPDTADTLELVYDSSNPTVCPDKGPVSVDAKGKVLLVLRGDCFFIEKLQAAYAAGAVAVVVFNHVGSEKLYMSSPEGMLPPPGIPQVIISKENGNALAKAIVAGKRVTVKLSEVASQEISLWQHTNLYVSGDGGTKYTVALKDVNYKGDQEDARGYVDVHKVSSVDGTYIANQVVGGKAKTLITYDKGALWWSLDLDDPSLQQENGCTDCSLHLALESAGATSGVPLPLSTDTATGIIMANGWISSGISATNPGTTASSFVSRNGGKTWSRVGTLPYTFAIMDHGGVLVMTPWRRRTDQILFSIDEGFTVIDSYKFFDETDQLAGEFSDSMADDDDRAATVTCERIQDSSGASQTTQIYECVRGNADWSPARVVVDAKTKTATATFSTGNEPDPDDDSNRFTTCVGKLEAGNTFNWESCGKGTWVKTQQATTVQIQGAVTEPGGTSAIIVLYWYDWAGKDWIGLRIDFSKIFDGKVCDADADFEDQTLSSKASDNGCLMGSKTTYKRRKRCSFCLNTLEKEAVDAKRQPCDCSAEDLKCAFGFYRAFNVDNAEAACSEDKDHFEELCGDGVDVDTPAMAFYERIPDNNCKDDDLSKSYLSPRATYCNGSPGPTTIPTDFSYRGCFNNKDDDRVDDHEEGGFTVEDCRKKAKDAGKDYFGVEWPHGFEDDGVAQCLLLDSIPSMHPRPDSECSDEVDSQGHLLGGGWRLAVYATAENPPATTTQAPATPPSDSGVKLIDGVYYEFVAVPDGVNFPDAVFEATSRTYGGDGADGNPVYRGHLATVNTKAVNDQLALLVPDGAQGWLGGYEANPTPGTGTSSWYWGWTDPTTLPKNPGSSKFATTADGKTAPVDSDHYWPSGGNPPTTPMASFAERRCTTLSGGGGAWNVPLCSDKTLKGYFVAYTAPVRGQFGASYYELVTTKLYWIGALKVASSYSYKNMPGHLVTVDSAAEDAFVASLISTSWLGGTVDNTMAWQWMAGPEAGTAFWDASGGGAGSTTGGYVNWGATQPTPLGNGQQACVQMHNKGGAGDSPQAWYSTNCYFPTWSVVEFEMPDEDVILYLDAAEYSGKGPWKDASGLNHDATLKGGGDLPANGVSFDEETRTFHFDGDQGGVFEVNINVGPSQYPQLTMELWFKFDADADLDSTKAWVISHDDGGYDRSLILADERFKGMGAGVGRVYDTGLGYPGKGVWHHAVAVFDLNTPDASYVALDGVVGRKITETPHSEGTTTLSIGGAQWAGHGMVGNIAMVKVQKKAMTTDELKTAYSVFNERYGVDSGPIEPIDVATFQVRQRPVANLRTDMDAAALTGNTFADSAGTGTWSVFSGAKALLPAAQLRPLKPNSKVVNNVVLPGSLIDLGAKNAFKLPGMSPSALIGGPGEGSPDDGEVSVHPGDPTLDPANSFLVVRWTTQSTGWYDLTGSVRDLGVMNDGVSISVNWKDAAGVPATERVGVVKRDMQAFQHRIWVIKGQFVDVLVGSNGNYYGDHAAMTIVISRAENFSPFVFNSTTTFSPAGCHILNQRVPIDIKQGYTSPQGDTVKLVTDVGPGASDSRSLQLTKNAAAGKPYAWFGADVQIACGETITMSAWIKFSGAAGVPKRGANSGFKHHGDADKLSAGDAPIDDSWLDTMKVDEWTFVESTWTADYTTGVEGSPWKNGDHLLLIMDSAPAGTIMTFCDYQITKVLAESEANLGFESTQSDVTPDGFYVGGSNFNVDLTKPYINAPYNSMESVYSDDVPDDANDPRSIQFKMLKEGDNQPFRWFGYQTTICKGDLVQFSVWLKFVGKVPPYDGRGEGGGGIGLKHHSGSNPANQDGGDGTGGDSKIYSDFLDGMEADTWTLVTKTWYADYSEADLLILIMDHAPVGTVGRFCDLRVTKLVNTPVLYFRGGGDYVSFPSIADNSNAAGLPVGDSSYTLEAWVQPHAHDNNGIVGWGAGPSGAGTTLSLGGNGQVHHGWGVDNGVPVLVAPNTGDGATTESGLNDGNWHHIAATYDGKTRVIYVNGVEQKRDTPGKPHAGVGGGLRIASIDGSKYFEGAIAEVRIWERALAGTEVLHQMTAGVDAATAEGLVGYWKLNDGGSTARDASTHSTKGLVIGATYNMRMPPAPVASGFSDFIVDSESPTGVSIIGSWIREAGAGAFQGDHYLVDGNRDKGKYLVRFEINVPIAAGYDVWMAYPSAGTRSASDVPVTIDHQSGKATIIVDERVEQKDGWLLLGTYKFKAGPAFITVSNKNTHGLVAVDAFKMSVSSRPLDSVQHDTWSAGCQSVTTQYNPGDFSYTVLPDKLPSTAITFSVKGKNDAHIGLVKGNKEKKNMYEIVIGGWGNQQSVIRNQHQGTNMVTKKTPDIISAHEWRSFWLTFSGGTIKIGSGNQVGRADTILMQWTDPKPMNVDHVAVGSGFQAGASWELCAVDGGNGGNGGGGGDGDNGLICGKDQYKTKVAGQMQCKPLSVCKKGEWQKGKPTKAKDRVCAPCAVGFSDTDGIATTKCVRCTAGHFVPLGSFGPCSPTYSCKPGEYDDDNTALTPCKKCPADTYSNYPGAKGKCKKQRSTCAKGNEADPAHPGSATALLGCIPCAIGKTFNSIAGEKCQAVSACQSGKVQKDAPTMTKDRTCKSGGGGADDCGPGNEKRGSSQCTPCKNGFTDHDFDSSTPCIACTLAGGVYTGVGAVGPCDSWKCAAGTYSQNVADACTPCINFVNYASESGAAYCTGNTECGAGYESDMETYRKLIKDLGPVMDKVCKQCGVGTFKPTQSQYPCQQTKTACSSGYQMAMKATPTSDIVCTLCPAGTFRDVFAVAGSSCQPWRVCPENSMERKAPTASNDRECDFRATTNKPSTNNVGAWVSGLALQPETKDSMMAALAAVGITGDSKLSEVYVIDSAAMMKFMGKINSADKAIILAAFAAIAESGGPDANASTGGGNDDSGGGGGGGNNDDNNGGGGGGDATKKKKSSMGIVIGALVGFTILIAVFYMGSKKKQTTMYSISAEAPDSEGIDGIGDDDEDDAALLAELE